MLAPLKRDNPGTNFDHLAGHFMAQNERFLQPEIANSSFVIIMKIGTTNATGTQPDQKLAGVRLRNGAVLNFKCVRTVYGAGFHVV